MICTCSGFSGGICSSGASTPVGTAFCGFPTPRRVDGSTNCRVPARASARSREGPNGDRYGSSTRSCRAAETRTRSSVWDEVSTWTDCVAAMAVRRISVPSFWRSHVGRMNRSPRSDAGGNDATTFPRSDLDLSQARTRTAAFRWTCGVGLVVHPAGRRDTRVRTSCTFRRARPERNRRADRLDAARADLPPSGHACSVCTGLSSHRPGRPGGSVFRRRAPRGRPSPGSFPSSRCPPQPRRTASPTPVARGPAQRLSYAASVSVRASSGPSAASPLSMRACNTEP